jgi:aryl-alcohol dehydrogenase-like predicted oxidoreductase
MTLVPLPAPATCSGTGVDAVPTDTSQIASGTAPQQNFLSVENEANPSYEQSPLYQIVSGSTSNHPVLYKGAVASEMAAIVKTWKLANRRARHDGLRHSLFAMPLKHYVTLGRSGLRVSPFCLGAMTFGKEWGWGSEPDEAKRIIDRFLDLGGNFIDTANGYTKGHSEAIIGEHLAHDRKKRDRVVIATKFVTNMFLGDPNGGGSNRKAIIAQCEESLRRLRTDYIDLYWMHAWDKTTPIDETMRALDTLVDQGKVRYIGFSDTPAWKCAEAQVTARLRGWAPLIALQIEYSLLQRTVEAELVPMAIELGVGITPWGPLRGGALSGKYKREDKGKHEAGRGARVTSYLDDRTFDLLDVLAKIASENHTTVPRVALAWVQGRPGVGSTIIGARTIEQLDDNLGALDVTLTRAQVDALDAASKPSLPFPMDMIGAVPMFAWGGTTINGQSSPTFPNAPQNDSERF